MPTERFTQTIHGFAVHGLRSETAELTVCPELGMRVIDFIDRRTGRRWFWGPPRGTSGLPNLFRNRPGDAFEDSPLLGMDECLPGIDACPTGPDHGEVWPRAATLIDDAPGTVRTRVSLPGCGLDFERAVTLDRDEARFDYRLTNPGKQRRAYLWAAHPMLTLIPGDRIELPPDITHVQVTAGAGVRGLMSGSAPWPRLTPVADAAALHLAADRAPASVKAFATGFARGEASLRNVQSGDRLSLRFDAKQIGALGVWINRGHWKDSNQVALQPTNAPVDSRSAAAAALNTDATHIAPGETKTWGWVLRTHPTKRS